MKALNIFDVFLLFFYCFLFLKNKVWKEFKKGRLSRKDYILPFIGYSIYSGLRHFVKPLQGIEQSNLLIRLDNALNSPSVVFITAVLIIMYTTKRFRDLNTSGWYGIFGVIPIVSLILCFIKGTVGSNKYGDDPLLK